MSLLIYGVTGFTGSLVSRTASAYGMTHIVASRSPEDVQAAAQWAGLEGRAFELEDPHEIARWLAGVKVVINCAGPFEETAIPLAQGCILAGAHYLDISSTASEHLALQALEPAAIQGGVMLMPGVGSALVPADCMAKMVVEQVKNPTHLTLAFHAEGKLSKGHMAAVLGGMAEPGVIRSNGTLRPCYAGVQAEKFQIAGKSIGMLTDPWRAEQVGVFRTTGIRNIETFSNFPTSARFMLKVPGQLESGAMKWFVDRTIRKTPDGPSDKDLEKSSTAMFVRARNKKDGTESSLTLRGPGLYELTALTAISCAYAAQVRNLRAGYQTPARAFGPELISKVKGVEIFS